MQQLYDYSECDIHGEDFTGKILIEANFSHSDAHGAIFSDADLRFADFTWANLRGAYFVDADLRDAGFWGAELHGATFTRCHVRHNTFEGAYVDDETTRTDNSVCAIEAEWLEGQIRAIGRDTFSNIIEPEPIPLARRLETAILEEKDTSLRDVLRYLWNAFEKIGKKVRP